MIAVIIVSIIIAGILISNAFTFSQDVEPDVSTPEEPVDTTPPSAEPTEGTEHHLKFDESMTTRTSP